MSSDQLKKQFFSALDQHQGSITAAARAVGANRDTAYGWARKAGIRGKGKPGASRPHPGRARYESLRAQGVPRKHAADLAGVHVRTARDWDRGIRRKGNTRLYPDGRLVVYTKGMSTTTTTVALARLEASLHPRYLSLVEREKIADLYREGHSLRQIGRLLHRPASTIKREIDARSVAGHYRPHQAHRAWAASRARPKESKLAQPGPLSQAVAAMLAKRFSPMQIRRALIRQFPHDQSMRVSHETIYQALYLQARGGLRKEVAAALRTGRARRRPRAAPGQRRSRFVDEMVMISQRPPEVEDRAVPGHWEGDLIIGAAGSSAILTLVERSTRYVLLGHLPAGHTAEAVRDVLVELIGTLPQHLRASLTWDQGCEMACHRQFTIATDVPVYFCDPHSPWQRGSNENTNGLLRQYFPKGTDLSVHSAQHLAAVAAELNERPRKTLDWDTPAERLRDLLTGT